MCLALGLGLALSRPDLRVIALDGDGAALMRLSAFATVGAYGPPNLWHLFLDNGVHDSTGGQATVSPRVAFRRGGRVWLCLDPRDDLVRKSRVGWPSGPSMARASRGFSFALARRRSSASLGDAGGRESASDAAHRRASRNELMLLLNPGPVSLSERVRRSLRQPDLCHRESEFFDLQDEALRRLLATYSLDPAQWTAVLMTASGTAASKAWLRHWCHRLGGC